MKHGGKRPGAGRPKGSKDKITKKREAAISSSGLTPLQYLLSIIRDTTQEQSARVDAAKAAAPYVHPRLAAIEHSGEIGNKPLREMTEHELDNELAETEAAIEREEKAAAGEKVSGSIH